MKFSILTFIFAWIFFASAFADTRLPMNFGEFSDKLVRVSSTLYDIGEERSVSVSGVGTVIAPESALKDSRGPYFVLTVGHIALGKNLKIETKSGKSWPLRRIFQDDTSDLVLIELDTTRMPPPAVMAYYKPSSWTRPGVLYTLFQQRGDPENRFESGIELVMKSTLIDDTFPAFLVDGVESARFLGGSGFSYVLQAPWLAIPEKRNMGLKPISRSLKAENLTAEQRFAPGYSGSPLVIPRGGGAWNLPIYTISGVLTASPSEEGSSMIAGPGAIEKVIERALKGKTEKSEMFWALTHGAFLQFANKLTIFAMTGPVGNGVVINGYSTQNLDFEKKLRLNLTKKRSNDLQFETFEQALKNVGEGLRKKQNNPHLLNDIDTLKTYTDIQIK